MKLDDFYKLYGFELVTHKRITRLMRLFKIKCSIRTKNTYHKIWKATKEEKSVPNLLRRKFKNASPRTIHLTDITYLKCKFGTAYLSAVKDSVTNEIVAYTVQSNLGLRLSLNIIDQLDNITLNKNAYIHSYQGVHYTSSIFRTRLSKSNVYV